MLPATFDSDTHLRVSQLGIGIFAIATLTAGFCLTLLLSFAVRNPVFQGDTIYLPALSSSIVGLLTVFYDFAISTRYEWSIAAILTIIAASVSTIVYASLLIWTHRKITALKSRGPAILRSQSDEPSREPSSATRWQDPAYYDNYIRNMFPSSAHPQPQSAYNPNNITEEEMQRQQMLMLLLHRDQGPSPDATQSTFRIDWQGQDPDDQAPTRGYYAPPSASTMSSAYPLSAVSAQWPAPQQLRPWDGVWRSPAPVLSPESARGRGQSERWDSRERSQERREARRQEIEMGR